MIDYLCGMNYRLERKKAKLDEICSKNVYPWLRDVGMKFKDFAAYPLCLSDYYKRPMDKQVAEVVSLLAPQKGRDKYIMALYRLLGKSPWLKVRRRNFMELSSNKSTLKNPFLKDALIFNLLDWIWEVTCEDKVPLEYAILGELGIIKRHHKTPLKNVIDLSDMRYRLEMVLVKMTLRDGYGTGLWKFLQEEDLPCPLTNDVRKVMSVFYPIIRGVNEENAPDILSFMGFEKQVDFLYSAWGYQYLRRHEPEATRAFENRLNKWSKSLYVKVNLGVGIPTDSMQQ